MVRKSMMKNIEEDVVLSRGGNVYNKTGSEDKDIMQVEEFPEEMVRKIKVQDQDTGSRSIFFEDDDNAVDFQEDDIDRNFGKGINYISYDEEFANFEEEVRVLPETKDKKPLTPSPVSLRRAEAILRRADADEIIRRLHSKILFTPVEESWSLEEKPWKVEARSKAESWSAVAEELRKDKENVVLPTPVPESFEKEEVEEVVEDVVEDEVAKVEEEVEEVEEIVEKRPKKHVNWILEEKKKKDAIKQARAERIKREQASVAERMKKLEAGEIKAETFVGAHKEKKLQKKIQHKQKLEKHSEVSKAERQLEESKKIDEEYLAKRQLEDAIRMMEDAKKRLGLVEEKVVVVPAAPVVPEINMPCILANVETEEQKEEWEVSSEEEVAKMLAEEKAREEARIAEEKAREEAVRVAEMERVAAEKRDEEEKKREEEKARLEEETKARAEMNAKIVLVNNSWETVGRVVDEIRPTHIPNVIKTDNIFAYLDSENGEMFLLQKEKKEQPVSPKPSPKSPPKPKKVKKTLEAMFKTERKMSEEAKENEKRTASFEKFSNKEEMSKSLLKSKVCEEVLKRGKCFRQHCTFAHTIEEFTPAVCVFGDACKHHIKGVCKFFHTSDTKESYMSRVGIRFPREAVNVGKSVSIAPCTKASEGQSSTNFWGSKSTTIASDLNKSCSVEQKLQVELAKTKMELAAVKAAVKVVSPTPSVEIVSKRTEAFNFLANKEELAKTLVKSKMCTNVLEHGHCHRAVCTFAHSLDELVPPMCKFDSTCKFFNGFKDGFCNHMHSSETRESFFKRMGYSKLIVSTPVVSPPTTPKKSRWDVSPTTVVSPTTPKKSRWDVAPIPAPSSEPYVIRVPKNMAIAAMEMAMKNGIVNFKLETY